MGEISGLSIPEKMNMAYYACDKWAQGSNRDNPAMLFDDRTITWGELQDSVNRVGNALATMGIKRGNRVLFRSQNCLELYFSILAAMKIGAVPVPTSSLFGAREIQHILTDTQAVAAIVHSDSVAVMDEVKSECLKHLIVIGESGGRGTPFEEAVKDSSTQLECADTSSSDEAFMLYTSGTTSAPKGIVHTHSWLIATGETVGKAEMELQPGDVTLSVSEIN